ncbi:UbiD family decarboxylase domain-containing protein [Streptomyces sp. bgisy100]|uniref:UbiD family decarboxylase domain-containing protein n=1 Tax=Streptomyces sp. bgisy100 TaxID=3413783 RepID=UPI003D73D47F
MNFEDAVSPAEVGRPQDAVRPVHGVGPADAMRPVAALSEETARPDAVCSDAVSSVEAARPGAVVAGAEPPATPPGLSLRAALAELAAREPGALLRETAPLARAEVAGRFARRHGGVPAVGVSRSEPAVLHTAVEGAEGPVLLGLYGAEDRLRRWLPGLPDRITPERARRLTARALPPVRVAEPACRERVTTGDRVDLRRLPVLTATPRDAGPYLTAALVRAEDPETGETALSSHRMLVLDRTRLTVWMVPGRQLGALYERAVGSGRRLPVTVSIGVPPAAMVASALGTRFLPSGLDKLAVAGALAGAPVALAPALTQDGASVLAESEIVLEGYLDGTLADETVTGSGWSLPEFLGYDGRSRAGLPVLTVTAVTHRRDPVYQAVIGPGREQSHILGTAGALSAGLSLPDVPGAGVRELHQAAAGGGMLLLAVAVRKESAEGDAAPARIARSLLAQHSFLKLVVVTDDDVRISCPEDLLWALTTRANLALDTVSRDESGPVPMDPSGTEEWARARGGSRPPGRVSVDATTPFALRERTARSYGLSGAGHDR